MITAYKYHIQFIIILIVMYVLGVWVEPVIYVLFPVLVFLLGAKGRIFELLILSIWMLILSDYIPVKNATFADLQFAKTLKPIIPLSLFAFFLLNKERFKPIPAFLLNFVPFFIITVIALAFSIKLEIGIQKTLSFILMYTMIPIYISTLHREQGELFWKSLLTYIIGMLTIGLVLGAAVPQIGLLEGGGRFKGIFGNPNGVGVFLNLTFILWIILEEFNLIKLTKKERWYVLFVIIASLLWCGSRNGIMSVVLFYSIYRIVKFNWFAGFLFIFVFVIFSDMIFQGFLDLVSFVGLESYFRVDSLEAGSGRQIAWWFAWTQIQESFFLGGGFGHDENVMRPNYYWLSFRGHDGGVHNSYLSFWFDSGLIGVIFYYGALIRIYLKSFKLSPIVLAFAVSIFFNSTYESWMVASLNPFTILFLINLTIFGLNLKGEKAEEVESQVEIPVLEPKEKMNISNA